jgi:hypothetical protein
MIKVLAVEFRRPTVRSSDDRHQRAKPSSQRGRIENLWILALAVAAIFGAFVLDLSPEGAVYLALHNLGWKFNLPETCMSRRIFGISCPGCGLTRSFVAMAHGEFDLAIKANLMGPVLFVLCWLQIPYRILRYLGYWMSLEDGGHLSRVADWILWILLFGLMFAWTSRLIIEIMN